MVTIEPVTFDPNAATDTGGRHAKPPAFSLADPGGGATLLLLLIGFVAPFVLFGRSGRASALAGSSFELQALIWVAFLAVILPVVQIFMSIRRFGGSAIRSNRDSYPKAAGVLGRVGRAHANTIESLAPFAAVILADQVLHVSNAWTVASAALYVAARYVHSVCYLTGVTIVRSSAFYAGVIGTIVAGWQLLFR